MCRPSDHLIEYIENQNIMVADIIKDLPDELPIHSAADSELNKDNVDSSSPQLNESIPNVNSQAISKEAVPSISQPVLTSQPVLNEGPSQTQVVIPATMPQIIANTSNSPLVVDRLGE